MNITGRQHGGRNAQCSNVLLDLPFDLPVRNSRDTVRTAHRGIDEMSNAGRVRGIGNVEPTVQFVLGEVRCDEGGLNAEHPVRTADSGVETVALVHVPYDEFSARAGKFGGRRAVWIPNQRPNGPAAGKQASGGGAALQPGRSRDEDCLVCRCHLASHQ
jgi:hypothetical protein